MLSLPLFETASQGCQKSISLKIKTTFCAPDEFLVHKGDVLHSIFYLSNGSMEVLQDGMVVAILGGFINTGRCSIFHPIQFSKILFFNLMYNYLIYGVGDWGWLTLEMKHFLQIFPQIHLDRLCSEFEIRDKWIYFA